MPKDKIEKEDSAFADLVAEDKLFIPKVGDIVKGTVIAAGKSEIKLDVDGVMVGIVRGRELYREAPEYANLKPGDEVEATVVDLENENGELELSFSYAGHQKAWDALTGAFENQEIINVKVKDANKGGLIINFGQIGGFLPVSQLSPDNYPRVSGGDKGKILEKLKSFVNKDVEVKIMDLSEKDEKFIVSEKLAWSDRQKDVISKYKPGNIIEGAVTAVTNFGAFVSFGEGMEGLIHISELAWQRIDNPADIVKVGDKVKAEIINVDGAKIFLSAKKLIADPWKKVKEKYKINDKVKGKIIKINPFGLFVELDNDIHALAHVSSLGLKAGEKMPDKFTVGSSYEFSVISLEPNEHRLGLGVKAPDGGNKKLSSTIASDKTGEAVGAVAEAENQKMDEDKKEDDKGAEKKKRKKAVIKK